MSTSIMDTAPRETALEAGGYVKGVAIGLVTQNKDPEGLCRVKVRYPWHDQPTESYWARLAMPMAGAGRGTVLIPEVGDEVLLAFEREDLRFPYVLGALWNGKDKPPRHNDDGKNDERILESRKHHYLLFDDGSQGVVELSHEKGRKVVLDDTGFAVQDENGNTVKVDSASGAMTIEAKGQLRIKAASISLETTGTLEIKASATLTLRGALVQIN
ncbi:MAG TPA: phage baseplate assembly protein V [Thermoanaerobaculia bacterium]|nr:phage baseplate assembly protein V [Thermoanaerobaculia bacterium]